MGISYGQGPAVSALFQFPAQNLVYYRAMTPWTRKASKSKHPSAPQEGPTLLQGKGNWGGRFKGPG